MGLTRERKSNTRKDDHPQMTNTMSLVERERITKSLKHLEEVVETGLRRRAVVVVAGVEVDVDVAAVLVHHLPHHPAVAGEKKFFFQGLDT